MTQTQSEMQAILLALKTLRTPAIPGEYDIHTQMAAAFDQAGLEYFHEYRLGPRCRIDFRIGSIGIEVKKGRPATAALSRQLRRYLASEALSGMIVVTQRGINLPATMLGKPVYVLSLNRLWGVALP